MVFKNRTEAGRLLAEALAQYKNKETVICALPRGGVVVGYEVAKALHAPLEIIITRKIGHPDNPEYAMCAVDEKGTLLCNEDVQTIDQSWLEEETLRQKEEAERRSTAYRKNRKQESLGGKTVIIVDDGIATGLTMRAAVRSIRTQNPKEIVVAVPVAPHEVLSVLRKETDAVVVLDGGQEFLGAIGAYYDDFTQVSDEEVIMLLDKASHRTSSTSDVQ